MTTAAIVQARMTSSRLPGKVLIDLAGHTVLAHVMRRCQTIVGVDVVCCATSRDSSDDAVVEEASRLGVQVFRGSLDDVLDRYRGAAEALKADIVLRVTADCPVIDPDICAAVLKLRASADAGYAANNMPPTWPHGLDCEAFTVDALKKAAVSTNEPQDREHVTPWLRRAPSIARANLPGPRGEAAQYRWTLDYPEDLVFFRTLFAKLSIPPMTARVADLLDTLRQYPNIGTINNMHHRVVKEAGVGQQAFPAP